jgi:hypothetical protein
MHWFLLGGKAAFKINDPFDTAAGQEIIEKETSFTGIFYDAILQHLGGVKFFVKTLRSRAVPVCDMSVVIET